MGTLTHPQPRHLPRVKPWAGGSRGQTNLLDLTVLPVQGFGAEGWVAQIVSLDFSGRQTSVLRCQATSEWFVLLLMLLEVKLMLEVRRTA